MRADLWCFAFVTALTIEMCAGPARGDEKDVPVDKLPSKIVATLKKRFPRAQLLQARQDEEDGKTEFEVTITDSGKNMDVTLTPSGAIEGIEMELAAKDLPKKIKAALATKHPKAVIKRVGAVFETEKGKDIFVFYDVALETADKRQVDVKIGLDGRIKADEGEGDQDAAWTRDFSEEKEQLTSTGRNPFFVLEPGYQLVLEAGKDRLTRTVLDETKTIDGVETRIVEERLTNDSELVEVSRDYFAISKRTNSVYQFGEDVDLYKGGKITGHDGSWLAGEKDARFGLAMPGLPLLGARYYEQVAPGTAMDRGEIVGLGKAVKVPAGEFKNCLVVLESTPLESNVKRPKFYASDVGLLRDGPMMLVRYGKVAAAKK